MSAKRFNEMTDDDIRTMVASAPAADGSYVPPLTGIDKWEAELPQRYRETADRLEQAEAEIKRMRPVVRAAQAVAPTNPHSAFPEVVRLRMALADAVETYEAERG